MLRLFALFPVALPARALADGSSGSIGADTVGAHELRDGSVGLTHMADLAPDRLLGRAGTTGAPAALTPDEAYAVIATAAPELVVENFSAAGLLNAPATAKTLRILGRNVSGDGGEALYFRVAAMPAHDGRVQTADGAWWEIDGEVIRPEAFGAIIGDGETDESAEIRTALNVAMATGRPLVVSKRHAVWSTLHVEDRVVVRGDGPVAAFVFHNKSQFLVKKGDGSEAVTGCVFDNMIFEDGGDQNPWFSTPLLEGWRATGWRITGCEFIGVNRRIYGVRVGRGSTFWASVVDGNLFTSCQIGVVIGDSGDATHNRFTSNTVTQNQVCGAIFANPHGGVILSNSFEFNKGRTALAVVSGTQGSDAKAVNLSIRNNYIYNNSYTSGSGDPESVAVLIGHDVPGTVYDSPKGAWALDVSHNYVVSPHTLLAIRANMVQGGRITHNVVETHSTATHDIEVSGDPARVDVIYNKHQQLTAFDRAVAIYDELEPAVELGSVLTSPGAVMSKGGRFGFRTALGADGDDRGGLTYRAEIGASANVPGEVLRLDQIPGADSAFVMLSVEQPLGGSKASFVLHLFEEMSGPVTPVSSAGTLAGASFEVTGGVLTLTRTQNWDGNVVAMFSGAKSAS